MDERVSKLPKWAQRKIELLEMRLREAEKRAEDNLALAGLQQDKYGDLIAPMKKRLHFVEGTNGISVRYEKGVLEVMGNGGGGLLIKPRVSNVVTITEVGH